MPSLEQLLTEMYTNTAPLRAETIKNLQGVMAGAPASSLPAYAPNRAAIEGQYDVATEQARSSLPRGGQLNRAILDLNKSRAGAVSGLESSIRGDALNRGASLGFGVLPSVASGMGSLAQQDLQRDAQNFQRDVSRQQSQNQTVGNIAQGIGLLATILKNW